MIEKIYDAYPRKIGRRKAMLEIDRALRRIRHELPHLTTRSDAEVEQILLNTVIIFANSPAGNRGHFTPHPSTWFHQSRYLDDPQEWMQLSREEQREQANAREANIGVWRPS